MPFEDGIKTVSGSVANFTDGAAKVGCESVVATITASLSGTNTAKVTHIPSNNMLCLPTADVTINSMRFYTVNGVMYLNGTQTAAISSLAEEFKAFDFWLPKGTYYFQRGAIALPTYIRTYDDGAEFQVNNGTFTITEPKHLYVSFYMANKSYTNAKADLCIKIGSTSFPASDYEDTAPKREYTASLGRTIYGAEVDVVKGYGKETWKNAYFNGSNEESWSLASTGTYRYAFLSNGYIETNTMYTDILCDSITVNNTSENTNTDIITCRGTSYSSKRFYVFVPIQNSLGISDLTTFKTWLSNNPVTIVYQPTAPTDFTFTGQTIESEYGENSMWSDGGGDTFVSYHDNTHGFCTVNVNRLQSKNLFDKNHANVVTGYINTTSFTTGNSNAKTIYIPIKANTTYTVSKTAGQRFWLATSPVVPTNNALYTDRQVNNTATSISITSGANDRYLWAWIYLGGTDTGTLEDMLASVQIEFGSSASTFEAYSGESKTAYLHKVIFGGEVDVISGTCENYYSDSVTFDGSQDETWQKHGSIASWFYIDHYLTGAYANNNENDFIMSSWGSQRKYLNVADIQNGEYAYGVNERFVIKNTSFTEVADFKAWLAQNPVTIAYKLATPSIFSFPPISMETDEGENTLFATEGASAIIYRKES